ncbi:Zn-dependent exopeptidase [Amniculicola lignicola CBS 123094]|uniref:Zn-dependent exopeptidase n=1 Tax=Amniculicola lignicola CBS 123094 TaxID=1392246 RepID=A0A6A5W9B4_9PLEO|nr:Zn-dependent exopeptidase [Amniculicola lignicola CBS 123094]
MKYALVTSLLAQSIAVLADLHLLPVQFKAPSVAHFQDIIRNDAYDFGCRPAVLPTTGGFILHAFLTEVQIEDFTKGPKSADLTLHRAAIKRQEDTAPIGTGDRFKDGTVTPLGLGTRDVGARIDTLLNVNEIRSAVKALANTYGVSILNLPYKTFEGATQFAGYVGGGSDKSKYHLYLTAGSHARERGGPDQLIYWISDLLAANKSGSGLAYGQKVYTHPQVKSILDAGIVFFPLVNPDGVAYDQKTGSLWRKNRNTKSGTGIAAGVDINRNFDFLWDFEKYFDPTVFPASTEPTAQNSRGTAPESEAEAKNLVSIYKVFPKVRWYMDIHSAVGDILYPWGHDEGQSNDTAQNFQNAAFDGKRGVVRDTKYKEYIPSTDDSNLRTVAANAVAAMRAVGGRPYSSGPAVGLYPTSGGVADYSFSRYWGVKGANKVYGFTLEFGYPTNFYPTLQEFNENILDTNAGFTDWALSAIQVGLT